MVQQLKDVPPYLLKIAHHSPSNSNMSMSVMSFVLLLACSKGENSKRSERWKEEILVAHIALVELSHTGKNLGGTYSGRHWLGMMVWRLGVCVARQPSSSSASFSTSSALQN